MLSKDRQWWRFLLVFIIVFLASNIVGAIPLGIVVAVKMIQGEASLADAGNMADLSRFGIGQNLGLFLMLIPFVIGLFIMIVLIKAFHRQSFKEVVNGGSAIRWGRFFFAFVIWAVLMGIYLAVDHSMNQEAYTLNFSLSTFLPLLVIVIVFIPFQTTYEEVMFRGYLAQGIGAGTRNRWLSVLIPGILFGLMHSINPEVQEYGFWITMPQYVLFGLVFGLTTVLDDGIEVAMGAHTANNIFLSLFVTTKASALQTPAVFMQDTVDPVKELYVLIAVIVFFVGILSLRYNWKFSVLNKKVVETS
jgi:membrane protease YdiL (CAAX protease family)